MIDQFRPPDRPLPGWYAARLVKRGPEVACRVVLWEDIDAIPPQTWVLLIGGEPTCQDARAEPFSIPKMEAVALYGRRITEAEYDALLDAAASAQPGEPLHDPTRPVDWRQAPSLY